MTTFQQVALLLIAIWFTLIVIHFSRSTTILVVGLIVIGLYTLVSLFLGQIKLVNLGLRPFWLPAISFAVVGLVISLAYSPLADKIASRWFEKPPTLDSFRAVQQSKINLVIGILLPGCSVAFWKNWSHEVSFFNLWKAY